MVVKKGDFVELDFVGRIKSNEEIFDTTKKDVAKKAGLEVKDLKPVIFSVGSKMLPVGFDLDIEGKEIGKDYVVELKPEEGFGKREPKLIKMIPTKLFHEQKINPERGMQLSLDGQLVRILSNSGGRTLVDFNHPLAGKEIFYEYKILREVSDEKEKIDSLQDFMFKKRFDFEIKGEKIIFKADKNSESIIKAFSSKFKEIIGKDIEVEVK